MSNKIITISMKEDDYEALESMRGLIPRSIFVVQLIKNKFEEGKIK